MIEHYGKMTAKHIAVKLKCSREQIKGRARRLGLKGRIDGITRYSIWTEEEIRLLRKIYATSTRDDLLKAFPRFEHLQIESKANKCGLVKNRDMFVLGRVSKLLDGTFEAMYWLGFLLADGHFSANGRIRLTLAALDRKHVKRFGRFIEFRGKYGTNSLKQKSVAVMDKEGVGLIKERYDIHHQKTYNPPDLNRFKSLSDDQMMALIIGFIDGDGSIIQRKGTKTCNLMIKNHASWLPFLNMIAETLERVSGMSLSRAAINPLGYAFLAFSNHPLNKIIKLTARRLDLPVLERKWERIDETFVNRYENSRNMEPIVVKMLENGDLYQEIKQRTGIDKSRISIIATRHGLRRR